MKERKGFLYYFVRNRNGMIGMIGVLLILLIGLVGPMLIAKPDGYTQDILQAPSALHWLGTDNIGLDIFAELVWGARTSLYVSVMAMLIAGVIGIPVGLLCLLTDMAKGFLPVWLAVRRFGPQFPLLPLVMAAPALGHALAPWYAFRGGKAIATAFGVLAGLLPFSHAVWALVFWYLFFSLVLIIRPNERRSIFAFLMFSLTCAAVSIRTGRHWLALGCALLAAVPIVKNHADLERAQAAMDKLRHTAQDA